MFANPNQESHRIGTTEIARLLNISDTWARKLIDELGLGIRTNSNRRLITPSEFSLLIAACASKRNRGSNP